MWEIRGLFGNEYALEQAVVELRKHEGLEVEVLDRRNLSVKLARRDRESEELVKRAFEMYHGFAEHEGPSGEYERQRLQLAERKQKKDEEKSKLERRKK